ncbi:MAG: 2-oxoacid:acceptor oxidoreductase family protein [Deltaproteobacteria bacterium]|nr:2-oxoacid:acceptor oxidoreductase family protein [Deltaproteobacteria bacterium]MBW2673652.1 2-oxoacid:acceptor oxidoreductase family protein [Deltaproteobacteria bacterium]
MTEIRFHGRGGQGTVIAAIILAKAFFRAGHEVQTFPVFGVERRGAPVEAYLRLDNKKILSRTNVYTPDHVVVQDRTLLQGIDVTKGLKPGGWILINAPESFSEMDAFAGFSVASVDASRIALNHKLGSRTHPIVNTAMIGAFASLLGMPPLDDIAQAIGEEIPIATELNIRAAEDAFRKIRRPGSMEGGNG